MRMSIFSAKELQTYSQDTVTNIIVVIMRERQ
jgi:hypothetical protein